MTQQSSDSLERRVGKNSLAIYAGRIANLGINLFVFVYLANYLGERSYGRLSFALTYIGSFDIIVNAGCNRIIVRELARGELPRDRILGTGFVLRISTLVLGILASWFGILALGYPKEVLWLVMIVSANLIFSSRIASARSLFETIYQAELRMHFPMALVLLDSLVFLVLVLWRTRHGAGLVEIGVLYTLANLGGFALLSVRFFRENRLWWRLDGALARYFLGQAVPVMFYLGFSNLNTRLDVLLVSLMRGDSEVGLYTSATRLVLPLTLFSTAITMSLYPVYSRAYRQNRQLFDFVLRVGTKLLVALGVGLGMGLFFNARWIYDFLYRPEYASATEAFRLLVVAVAFVFLTFYFVEVLISTGHQHLATVTMLFVLASNIGLNVMLIQRFGFLGAAYTRLATAVLSAALFGGVVFYATGVNLARDWLRMIALAAVYGLMAYFVRDWSPFIQLPILALSLLLLILPGPYFRPDEKQLLRHFAGLSQKTIWA